jgi:hypothetical protein
MDLDLFNTKTVGAELFLQLERLDGLIRNTWGI